MAKAGSAKGKRLHAQAQARRRAAAVEVPDACDLAVVGGGASGLACALGALWAHPEASVVVLDAADQLGRPLLATGNGRCNLSHEPLACEAYRHPRFVEEVLGPDPEARVAAFFDRLGVLRTAEEGRLYPQSLCAGSVQGALLNALAVAGGVGAPLRAVTAIDPSPAAAGLPSGFSVAYEERFREAQDRWAQRVLRARRVVLATGGGATLASQAGLPLVPCSPVLCAVAVAGGLSGRLAGHRVRCEARLERDGAVAWRERGEVLFRERCLSGIVAFDLSRVAQPGDRAVLDLFPDLTAAALRQRLERLPRVPGRQDRWLDPLLDPVLGEALLSLSWDPGELAALLKALAFEVTGLAQTDHAQVTRGGVALQAVRPQDLQVRDQPGLFVCGEALDVDAACGGYNLAFAWLSGLRAGAAALLSV